MASIQKAGWKLLNRTLGTFAVLQKNVDQNKLSDVAAHNCALWDKDGQLEFFVDREHPGSLLMSANPPDPTGKPFRFLREDFRNSLTAPSIFSKWMLKALKIVFFPIWFPVEKFNQFGRW
jgi:hypothetical protein